MIAILEDLYGPREPRKKGVGYVIRRNPGEGLLPVLEGLPLYLTVKGNWSQYVFRARFFATAQSAWAVIASWGNVGSKYHTVVNLSEFAG